jgi:AbrB family looped-hinge helix DNA binding protein
MTITIDRAGRVVIPAPIREKLGLRPGTRLELSVEDAAIRLAPTAAPPQLVRKPGRLVARPTVPRKELPAVDVVALIEEERNRWP